MPFRLRSSNFATQAGALVLFFFISGFSSLCYQIVWQRVLFSTFGINIQSVTIVVSLFMFGLGVGAWLGTYLQRFVKHLLPMFILCEIMIALFGIFSRDLIVWLGAFKHIDTLWEIGLCVYAVFALPTMMMGATLPLLVGHINRYVGHTGKSIGWLYASNTFGAVAASYMTVEFFFVYLGLKAVVGIAVCLNLLTAALALGIYMVAKPGETMPLPDVAAVHDAPEADRKTGMSARAALFLGFAIGYVSLSQELIWYRVLGYISANKPQIFGLLLVCFLSGIGFASMKVSRLMTSLEKGYKYILGSLINMLIVWYVAFPAVAVITSHGGELGKLMGLVAGMILAGVTAFFSGGVFPVLCHILQMRTGECAGKSVGKLYFANVMGATLGPLLTGFVLFEYCTLPDTILITGLLGAFVLMLMVQKSEIAKAFTERKIRHCVGVTMLGVAMHFVAYDQFFERLQFPEPTPVPFDVFSYNRTGVIGIRNGDIYGNGAYDGKTNINPDKDSNGISRAYSIAAFHANPKRILQVGLSGGSWATVFSLYKPLESLTSVEINKGYLDVIGHYPDHATILTEPKVHLIVDDGRRWVKNHPKEKFDVIVMNSIYHWRSNATNLLSKEFMEMCKSRLNPGGMVFINTTGSREVAYTAAQVFPYVSVAFGTMIVAGDAPAGLTLAQKKANLKQFYYTDGKPVFADAAVLQRVAERDYKNDREEILNIAGMQVITDDNMATEFRLKR